MTGNASSSSPFDGGISRYLAQIRRFALLDPGLEYELAKRCREADDEAAAQSLVNSHLRLAAKIAFPYRHRDPWGCVCAAANTRSAGQSCSTDGGTQSAKYASGRFGRNAD